MTINEPYNQPAKRNESGSAKIPTPTSTLTALKIDWMKLLFCSKLNFDTPWLVESLRDRIELIVVWRERGTKLVCKWSVVDCENVRYTLSEDSLFKEKKKNLVSKLKRQKMYI